MHLTNVSMLISHPRKFDARVFLLVVIRPRGCSMIVFDLTKAND